MGVFSNDKINVGVCRGDDTPGVPPSPPGSPMTRSRTQFQQVLFEQEHHKQQQPQQQQQQREQQREGLPTRRSTRAAAQAGRRYAHPHPWLRQA